MNDHIVLIANVVDGVNKINTTVLQSDFEMAILLSPVTFYDTLPEILDDQTFCTIIDTKNKEHLEVYNLILEDYGINA